MTKYDYLESDNHVTIITPASGNVDGINCKFAV